MLPLLCANMTRQFSLPDARGTPDMFPEDVVLV